MNKRKRKVEQLKRRAEFLKSRIANYTGTSTSYDEAELSAIRYSINIIEAAEVLGLINEIETFINGLPLERAEHEG